MKSDAVTYISKYDQISLAEATSSKYTEVACNQDH